VSIKAQKDSGSASSFDWFKWIVVVLIIAGAVVANLQFASMNIAVRACGLIILAIIALLIAVSTSKGSRAWAFAKSARMEMRKVVWPTRQETVQTTLIVAAVVIAVALVLWGIDSIFAFLVGHFIIK
jgi:preprotein translocase subunit SecE